VQPHAGEAMERPDGGRVEKRPVEKRGWEQGSVGWGVQGTFGDAARDTGSAAHAKKGNLVKDAMGRWVKVRGRHIGHTNHRNRHVRKPRVM
jgi:hypothetical protein